MASINGLEAMIESVVAERVEEATSALVQENDELRERLVNLAAIGSAPRALIIPAGEDVTFEQVLKYNNVSIDFRNSSVMVRNPGDPSTKVAGANTTVREGATFVYGSVEPNG